MIFLFEIDSLRENKKNYANKQSKQLWQQYQLPDPATLPPDNLKSNGTTSSWDKSRSKTPAAEPAWRFPAGHTAPPSSTATAAKISNLSRAFAVRITESRIDATTVKHLRAAPRSTSRPNGNYPSSKRSPISIEQYPAGEGELWATNSEISHHFQPSDGSRA